MACKPRRKKIKTRKNPGRNYKKGGNEHAQYPVLLQQHPPLTVVEAPVAAAVAA